MVGDETRAGVYTAGKFMLSMEGMEPPKFTVDKTIAEGDSVVCCGEMTMNEKEPRHQILLLRHLWISC